MTAQTYPVTAVRQDGWWNLEADLGHRTVASQARSLDAADTMIREAIAMVLDVDDDTFHVDLHPRLTHDSDQLIGQATRLAADRARLAVEQDRIGRRTRALVAQLRDTTDLTMRDVAALLDISPALVARLASV